MIKTSNAMRLRPGIADPVVLMFSYQLVMECDVGQAFNKEGIRLSKDLANFLGSRDVVNFDGPFARP
jgi:hypothetical protein